MGLSRIVLRLARNPGYPQGDDRRGYVIVAPLGHDGKIDVEQWRRHRELCTVIRFDPDPDMRADGVLTHRGSHWRFHYDEAHEGPDEGGYHLQDHVFRPGEYVTINDDGVTSLTFIVSEVTRYRPPPT